jgi:hypothetical protein
LNFLDKKIFLTTKQVSGLKFFLEIKRWVNVDTFVGIMDSVCSMDEDEVVFVLLSVDDESSII